MLRVRSLIKAAQSRIRGDVKYHSLLGNGHASPSELLRWEKTKYPKKTSWSPFQNRRGRAGIACVLLIILIFCFSSTNTSLHSSSGVEDDGDKPRHFRLMIPASQADSNLCKTLVSAAILGYSTPSLVNWNQTFEEPNLIFGGSRIAKIGAVLTQLQTVDPQYDDDLVLIIDGYDVWFQLRPDVLIERFFDINRRANGRLRDHLGNSALEREGISQKVIFSSQKRCWPKGQNHPACWAVPESTLPQDIYGPDTDKDVGDEGNPYVKFRQRYLNSGSVMGTVAAVRQVFERAAEIAKDDKNIGSDQGVFSQIFGEQEFHRRHVAMRSRNVPRRLVDWILKNTGRDYSYRLIDPKKQGSHHFMKLRNGRRYEFGIGLDYESRISQATVFSENDADWISFKDRSSIHRTSKDKNVPLAPPVVSVPPDIGASQSPFHSLGGGMPDGSLPTEKTWADVPLFTNLWTGFSPVAIHHSAHRNGLKNRIQTQWNETWYQSSARALLTGRLQESPGPIAVTTGSGTQQEWFSPTILSSTNEWSLLGTDRGYQLHFDELCAGTWQELFRDNYGQWTDPRPSPDDSTTLQIT